MIVNDFNLLWSGFRPDKTDAELVVDANAVLPGAVAFQRFEPVARGHPKIIKPKRLMQVQQLPARRSFYRTELEDAAVIEERFSSSIAKRADHGSARYYEHP